MSKALCRSPVRLPVVVLLFCLVFSFWLRFDCDFVVLVQTLAAARFGVDLIILLNRATPRACFLSPFKTHLFLCINSMGPIAQEVPSDLQGRKVRETSGSESHDRGRRLQSGLR